MLQFFKKLFGDKHQRNIKPLEPIVKEINDYYETFKGLSDDELRAKTAEVKAVIQEETAEIRDSIEKINIQLKEDAEADAKALADEKEALQKELDEKYEDILDRVLPEVYAIVKSTCERLCGKSWSVMGHKITWQMVPFDVQLMGGIVLHQGKIAEMATGEGKTLVATLPIFLNALTGRGVHLVTVNDYLAQRDAEWMGEVYTFHGLTVGTILSNMNPDKRREAYNCDIVYGTNNEFGFDYLRDNMASGKEYQVQREHIYAIVDEVDSVLIDEARTPLIISGAVDSDDQKFNEMKPRVERLVKLQTQFVAKILGDAEEMLAKAEKKEDVIEAGKLLLRASRGLPKSKKLFILVAEPENKNLLQDTELEFLREKGKNMYIIDDELYFVIDEKNHTIDLTEKGREELSHTTHTDKNFFTLPDLGTEISKFENSTELTGEEKAKMKADLYRDFSEKSDRIHTIHQLLKAYALYEKDDEYVITEEGKIAIVDEFTGRVLAGRRYSDGLHQAIEAKENVRVERDTQTLATITLQNYFRMYKKLAGMTGTAETEEGEFFDIYKLEVVVVPTNRPITRDDQDDSVYKTKRDKYNAVVDKIIEIRNSGRPILVGTTSVEVSETVSRLLKRGGVPHNVLNAKQHQREAEIISLAGEAGAVTIATNMAGRGTDIKLGPGVKENGGLFILGTERHESRRIDRQLRGRSGRQGDPGTTKFFLSLEDDLMRLFGSDRVAPIMSRLGLQEGEVIQHPLITKSVERAQKKVEENNFAIRKRLLEYDNVMNQQREVIYGKRRRALEGERLKSEILEMLEDMVTEVIEKHYENAEIDLIKEQMLHYFMIDLQIDPYDFEKAGKDGLKEKLIGAAKEFYQMKEERLSSELMARIERYAVLSVIDTKWKEHLREMDDLKEGINLRAYGQKDPLLEYKSEAFKLFVALIEQIRNESVSFCFKFFPQTEEEVMEQRRRQMRGRMMESKQDTSNIGLRSSGSEAPPPGKPQPDKVDPKVGRNDPCPCGSGKKYKQCHGKV